MYPIIYVRGYAMMASERDTTTADPFCGFNTGSTVYRAVADRTKSAKKFVFESPVIRLSTDFGYKDVIEDGLDIMDDGWDAEMPAKSIIIYHYYESGSRLLGTGKSSSIKTYAKGLSDLILKVRDLVCGNAGNNLKKKDFRCHLVAHSMGGLVCRAFLQNSAAGYGDDAARDCVDKFFTYATPHNGIEVAGVNIPSWLGVMDMDNFSRKEMADYLGLKEVFRKTKRVDWIPEHMEDRVFCMIGTNRSDYDVLRGASRTFAGHGSDGLVRIECASLWGINDKGVKTKPCARAFAYRSHSGYFGIVNSEEAYQNLIRFLFGDVRIDIWADVESVRLPTELQKAKYDGKVDALYQFELLASPRGKPWFLTRRVAEEDSVACRSHKELTKARSEEKAVYLSTAFLGNRWKVKPNRNSLAYGLTFRVRVPDYEVDKSFWFDDHFEGQDLFERTAVIEIFPPSQAGGDWTVEVTLGEPDEPKQIFPIPMSEYIKGNYPIMISFDNPKSPGIKGKLRLVISPWNC